jgi:hypothetical protein
MVIALQRGSIIDAVRLLALGGDVASAVLTGFFSKGVEFVKW